MRTHIFILEGEPKMPRILTAISIFNFSCFDRHCKSKASMAHTLIHWRYHLNEWVVGYLERIGILENGEILNREHWSQKKRTKYANEVVDAMVQAGEVDRLWRDFNLNLKTARASTVGYSPFPCFSAFLNTLTPV